MRIVHKKELGCQAMVPVVIKEELVRELEGTAKMEKFWELLGGKKGVKCELFVVRRRLILGTCTIYLQDLGT